MEPGLQTSRSPSARWTLLECCIPNWRLLKKAKIWCQIPAAVRSRNISNIGQRTTWPFLPWALCISHLPPSGCRTPLPFWVSNTRATLELCWAQHKSVLRSGICLLQLPYWVIKQCFPFPALCLSFLCSQALCCDHFLLLKPDSSCFYSCQPRFVVLKGHWCRTWTSFHNPFNVFCCCLALGQAMLPSPMWSGRKDMLKTRNKEEFQLSLYLISLCLFPNQINTRVAFLFLPLVLWKQGRQAGVLG